MMRKFVLNRTLVPVLVVVTSISLSLVAGLSYYTYRLNHELKQQQAQTTSSRVLQLIESAREQQAPSVNPQTPADPFASLFASPFSGAGVSGGSQTLSRLPEIQILESPNAFELIIALKEGAQLELNTDVQDHRLMIAGTLQWQEESNSGGRFYSSTRSSRFSRTLPLPGNVDATGLVKEHRGDEIVIRLPRV